MLGPLLALALAAPDAAPPVPDAARTLGTWREDAREGACLAVRRRGARGREPALETAIAFARRAR